MDAAMDGIRTTSVLHLHSKRRALAATTASALAAMASNLLLSSHAAAAEPELEVLVVTGSRIPRSDFESPSLIVTVPRAAFDATGAVTVERTLATYPQLVPSAGATSNSPHNDGQANLSLRGLGANRTLVLLDGRRMMPADGRGAVDVNILPPALIESVQILTGGASATYGSDAVAGVVDFRLRHDLEGIEFEGSASTTERGDAATYSGGVTVGTSFATGRGSFIAHAGYAQRDEVTQADRSFAKYPLRYVPGLTGARGPGGAFEASGSGITPDGVNVVFGNRNVFNNIFAAYGYPPGSVPYQAGIGVNADGSLFTIGNDAAGSVVNYRGERDPVMFSDRAYNVYNFAPDTALQMPLQRVSAFARGELDLTESLDVYAQVLYADYSVERQLASAPISIALIAARNPFLPTDLSTLLASRPSASDPYRYFRRASEVGAQAAINDRDVLQVTAGVRGAMGDDWQFDAYAQYGANDRTERQTNNVSLSRLQQLTFASDGGLSLCAGGFNPYLAGSLSSECAQFIAVNASNAISVRQTLAEASISGPLLTLPAGLVRMAGGLFYKRDEFDYDADAALSAVLPGVPGIIGPRPDISGFAAAPDRSGHESNTDAYVELRLPILPERLGAQSLELGLGYRYSKYSQAGDVDSYKAEVLYRPASALRLRGSLQHAVRAPSVEELYYPPVSDQFVIPIPDPCDAGSVQRNGSDRSQVEALCLAQGLPATLFPTYDYELRRVDGVAGGNPDLRPEEADTTTLGFVYTLTSKDQRWRDMQLALDWYRIKLEDGIGRWDSESAVARCFDPTFNPTYEVANVYCTFFSRDATTGNIFAQILDRNIGGLDTAGVDVQVDWGMQAGAGEVGLSALVSYVSHWNYRDPSGGTIEYAGTVGGQALGLSLPRWKSLVSVTYAQGDFGALVRWNHVDDSRDVEFRDFQVPSRDYVDVGLRYAFTGSVLRGFSAHLGAENVLDETPPIFPSWQQANTDPSQYAVLGRSYYLRLQYEMR
jgi:iron complex outermembrane recepter protein